MKGSVTSFQIESPDYHFDSLFGIAINPSLVSL
jgi:hypothetical protein